MKFSPPDSGGRPEWVQARRDDLTFLFSKCELGKTYLFKEQLEKVSMELANTEDVFEDYLVIEVFISIVFAARIMPALKLFGLIF